MPKFWHFHCRQVAKLFEATRDKVQDKISHDIFAADQRLFDVSYQVSTPSPAPQASSHTTPSSATGSGDVIMSDLMMSLKFCKLNFSY
jgi:hypothetical protein